jgi:hypothetical protein
VKKGNFYLCYGMPVKSLDLKIQQKASGVILGYLWTLDTFSLFGLLEQVQKRFVMHVHDASMGKNVLYEHTKMTSRLVKPSLMSAS